MDASKSPGRMLQKRLGIRAPAAAVFQALTDAAELARWFPTAAESDPRPGGAYRFRFASPDPEQSRTREGTFLEVQPNKRLSYTWHAPLAGTAGAGASPETKVEIALTEKAGTTDVVLTHSGFGYGPDWDRSFESHSGEWAFFVMNLRSYLERGLDARPAAPAAEMERAPAPAAEPEPEAAAQPPPLAAPEAAAPEPEAAAPEPEAAAPEPEAAAPEPEAVPPEPEAAAEPEPEAGAEAGPETGQG